jgi:hypothetical protein
MHEVMMAHNERRQPSLFNVRRMLTEADEYAPGDVARKRPIKGLCVTAARMIASGNAAIASLAGRFVRQHGQNELSGIQSTASTQTEIVGTKLAARSLENSPTGGKRVGGPAPEPETHGNQLEARRRINQEIRCADQNRQGVGGESPPR